MRRRVVAFAAAAFVAVWLFIYVQLVDGKDPALSTSSANLPAQTSTSSTSTGSTSNGSSSSSDNSTSSSGTSASSNSSSPSPVTTSQS